MLTAFLPLVALLLGEPAPASAPAQAPGKIAVDRVPLPASFTVGTPREAQAELARLLVDADSIESVAVDGRSIRFVILDRGAGHAIRVRTTKRGLISSLSVMPFAVDVAGNELGALSWLGTELEDTGTRAITRLTVDDDGAVLVTTSEAREYLIIPGRGSGGGANDAASARWAAAWNRDAGDES